MTADHTHALVVFTVLVLLQFCFVTAAKVIETPALAIMISEGAECFNAQ